MFDVSNAIAYDGMMVYGTSGQREHLTAPPSGWIDIPATGDARGHWIPAEGEQARKMLSALRSKYDVDARQIFVVSAMPPGVGVVQVAAGSGLTAAGSGAGGVAGVNQVGASSAGSSWATIPALPDRSANLRTWAWLRAASRRRR